MARTKDNDFDTNYPAPPNWGDMKNLRVDQYRKEDVDDTVERVLKRQEVNRDQKGDKENIVKERGKGKKDREKRKGY
jgi:hypothetical protein